MLWNLGIYKHKFYVHYIRLASVKTLFTFYILIWPNKQIRQQLKLIWTKTSKNYFSNGIKYVLTVLWLTNLIQRLRTSFLLRASGYLQTIQIEALLGSNIEHVVKELPSSVVRWVFPTSLAEYCSSIRSSQIWFLSS